MDMCANAGLASGGKTMRNCFVSEIRVMASAKDQSTSEKSVWKTWLGHKNIDASASKRGTIFQRALARERNDAVPEWSPLAGNATNTPADAAPGTSSTTERKTRATMTTEAPSTTQPRTKTAGDPGPPGEHALVAAAMVSSSDDASATVLVPVRQRATNAATSGLVRRW